MFLISFLGSVVFLQPLFLAKSFSFCIFTPLTMLDFKALSLALAAHCVCLSFGSFSPKQISHSSCPYNSVVFQMLAHEHAMVSSKGLRMLLAKGNINNMHGAALVRLS
uniref:Uncharacterized protein n=1 Tax=Salix viminalis TaxID=40686 RepID=A0A6N2N5V2_SALVM